MTDTLYRLRGLEWETNGRSWWAFCPDGLDDYKVWEVSPGLWRWQNATNASWGHCDSLSAAQSAAEAHYRARMAEGLVEVPPCECCGAVLGLFPDCQGVPLCKECFDSLDPDDCDCPKHRKEPTK